LHIAKLIGRPDTLHAVQAETRTLTQLFQLDVRYVIPLYQRPYVWTEERQWAPLWEDIATVADHVVADGASARSPTHFLGAIVIQQQENAPGSPQRFLVIDGQQRLTTLQLLVTAAARTADDLGFVNEGELLRRLTYNNELLAQDDERFKVWPTNANQAAFRIVMDPDGRREGAADDPGNEIQEAYDFFRRQVAAWVVDDGAGGGASDVAPQFASLRVTLSDLLKVVSIRLEDGDNPQVIFETLNARGTPLIALDLLKNAVFLAAAAQGPDTDRLYREHWAPELDLEYWRTDRRAGRLFTKNGDLFLQYWLVAELAEPVPATELFGTFRERVLQRAACPPMGELIPSLVRDAGILRRVDSAPAGSPERRFFDLLDLLDTTTLMPIALVLLRSPEVTAERRANAFALLESFLVRRMLCGWTTKNYNRLAAGLVDHLKRDLAHPDDVLRRRLEAETAPANRWPRDSDLRDAILEKDLYGQRRQDRLVMVLWEVEKLLRAADPKAEQGLAKPQDLTLEHIIPQSWMDHWPLDETHEDPLAWRSAHIHRLGNLTLTNGRLNASLSNGPWHARERGKDKRRGLLEHSLLKLNARLAGDHPERFDENDVDARGVWLAEVISAAWAGPAAEAGLPPRAAESRQRGSESIADLIAAGLHKPGTRLRPMSVRHDGVAVVADDGSLKVAGEVVNAPSTAASRVSGNATEPGWDFWGVPGERTGELVSLADLRERMRAVGGPPPVPGGGRRGPGRKVYDVTIQQLCDAQMVVDGETVVALRKRVGPV
jgi:hypothetical protein